MTKTIANEPADASCGDAVVAGPRPAEPHAPDLPQAPPAAPKRKRSRMVKAERSVSTRALVERIRRVADRHMAEIEARMPGLGSPEASERDSRTLARLARLVRELAAAEAGTREKAGATGRRNRNEEVDDDAPPRDIDAFRDELARRLERLRQARSGD